MNQPRKPAGPIFDGALELPRERRAAFLDEACAGDAALRRRVEALLSAHEGAGAFMEKMPPAPVLPGLPATPADQSGEQIERYKLLQQIGVGGCGVVYLAEQLEPVRRRVALKIIKLGMDTKEVIARFSAERQALALMDHPHIAKVLDAGATDTGRPYFVMELVRGVPITRYCDEKQMDTRKRLELFIQVCHAVQHAHQKGIIHRDLKPSNILVADDDGVPLPKVIDFGIAKATAGQTLTDKTVFTALEQFIGTPAYMSPEQAKLSALEVDTRSDIYSLGVLLYELLTGSTPFNAKRLLEAGFDEIRRIIREEEPPRPSQKLNTLTREEQTTTARCRQTDPPRLLHFLSGDMDWIVMKCLEKDRARRYETANGLAADVKRHLNNEPIVARPPSVAYKFQKAFRRNKLIWVAGLVVIVALLLGTAISTRQAVRATRAEAEEQRLRSHAEAAEKSALIEAAKSRQVTAFLVSMFNKIGPDAKRGEDTVLIRDVLADAATRVGTDFKDQPDIEEDLRGIIAKAYFYALEDETNAEAVFRPSLMAKERRLGAGNSDVISGMSLLADILRDENRLPEAEALERQALAGARKLAGDHHVEIAELLKSLGLIEESAGRNTEAAADLLEAAKLGDPYAQEELATLYRMGVGVPRDYQQALIWDTKSAGTGNPIAELHLGRAFYAGLGVDTNLVEAAKWFRKSADAGNGFALIRLGKMYEQGAGMPQDYVAAVKWYRQAADLGTKAGAYNLGRMYEHGLGVQKDLTEAIIWYRKSERIDPESVTKSDPDSLIHYAWVLSTSSINLLRDGPAAIALAQRALAAERQKDPNALATLAAAYAEAGQFTNAIAVQREALTRLQDTNLQADFSTRLRLFESNTPYRSPN